MLQVFLRLTWSNFSLSFPDRIDLPEPAVDIILQQRWEPGAVATLSARELRGVIAIMTYGIPHGWLGNYLYFNRLSHMAEPGI
jgi:hypothetical protein